ncbi:MAG: DUF4912 domain-containing protein [Thermoguttaceae bacterium]
MTVAQLKTRTVKDLAAIAKRKGVSGWHAMRKEELIQALAKLSKADVAHSKRNGANGCSGSVPPSFSAKKNGKNGANHHVAGVPKVRPARVERRLNEMKTRLAQTQDLAFHPAHVARKNSEVRDRLVVMVRDPYWLHVYWEMSRQSIERAKAALSQDWHGAKPVLRLLEVARNGTTSSVRKVVRDIEIHGGVNNWYVDVQNPPKSYEMEIGYLSLNGRFASLAKSNVVTTPSVGPVNTVDGNWAEVAEDFDRIFALSGGYGKDGDNTGLKDLFEERLHRPMGSPMVTRFGLGPGQGEFGRRDFSFEVDAELIVYGVTDPNAYVTLRGEPVRLQPDGTFSMRFSLPNRRQVLPVVASSGDGVEQRTIVLAVERNTKVMEPILREADS